MFGTTFFAGDNILGLGGGGIDIYTKLLIDCRATGIDDVLFTDYETVPKTVTTNGDTIAVNSPVKYNATSIKFDGTGDYLSLADSADWNLGSGDFTFDVFVNFASLSGTQAIFCQGNTQTGPETDMMSYFDTDQLWFQAYTSDTANALYRSETLGLSANTWYHLAIVRNTTNFYIFVNGISKSLTVLTAIGSNTLPNIASELRIGSDERNAGAASKGFNGYMDSFRVSKGIARWTANFTPPTANYKA